jgi:natural product precursor
MKTKRFNKKLALNKKTIANLDLSEMNVVKGGFTDDAMCYPSEANSCDLACQDTGVCYETHGATGITDCYSARPDKCVSNVYCQGE